MFAPHVIGGVYDNSEEENSLGKIYKEGQSLFTVIEGSESVSSGPYFLNELDALKWGFLHYLNRGDIIPDLLVGMFHEWEPKVDFDLEMDVEKAKYYKLPPVLSEVKLTKDFEIKQLKDNAWDFSNTGKARNTRPGNSSQELQDFYTPAQYKMHTAALAQYKISAKYNLGFAAPTGMPCIRANTTLFKQMKSDLIMANGESRENSFFWRFYNALILSSPQNVIKEQIHRSIDWPNIILHFLNYRELNNSNQFSFIESRIWLRYHNFLGSKIAVNPGFQNSDPVIFECILRRCETLADSISLLSVNKKSRFRIFNAASIQGYLMKTFMGKANEYWSMIEDASNLPGFQAEWRDLRIFKVPAAARNKRAKLFRAGLFLDVDDMELLSDISPHRSLQDRVNIIKTANGFASIFCLYFSTMWNKRSAALNIKIRHNGVSVTRNAYLPLGNLEGSNLLFRKNIRSPKQAMENMRPNETYAFDLMPYCFVNTDVFTVLDAVKSQMKSVIENRIPERGMRMTARFYDENYFLSDVSFTFMRTADEDKCSLSIGPIINESTLKMIPLLRFAAPSRITSRNRIDGLDSPDRLIVYTDLSDNTLQEIYENLCFIFRFMILSEGAIRIDQNAELF